MAIAKTQTLFSVRKTSLTSRLLATVGVRTPCTITTKRHSRATTSNHIVGFD
jgi:hypothetical protein